MIENTKLYQELQQRGSNYLEGINKVFKHASDTLPKINRIFANYTGHGVEHSINVIEYMYALVTDISQMSDLEITCLIDAALLHDIGMAANEDEIIAIKNNKLIYQGRKYSVIYDKFQNENLALQECVRPVHGERSSHFILQMDKGLFVIPGFTNCNFQEELAKICQAHTMDKEWLLQNLECSQVKGKDALNAQYVAMLLRVADYLDIDEKRAPIELYRFLSPEGFGDEEWRQHYIIENTEKVVRNNISGDSSIIIYGKCNDAKIHRKFLRYLSNISEELIWCTSYTRKHFDEKYWLLVQPQIDNRIITEGFEISDLKMQMDYYAVVTLLMGENVYGNKKCGLRELIQNAVDACRVMAEEAEHMEKYRYDPYLPVIQIIIDHKTNKMIVMDNGIGMDNDVLTKFFLTIGKSYYKSNDFLYQGKSYCPTGTFGIGFLACFMLSDSVVVETKHYTEQEGFTIELERNSEFICRRNNVSFIRDSGTAIILNLESVLKSFKEEKEIKEYVEKIFLAQGVPIRFITINDTRNEEILQLKTLEELNPKGIKLDSYLNGISACWEFQFENLRIIKKFSELCLDEMEQLEEQIYATLDFETGKLCLEDTKGEDLKKYIVNDHMMVLKIQGIKDEVKEAYALLKHLRLKNKIGIDKLSKFIYIPIKYNENFLKYCVRRMSYIYNIKASNWHDINEQNIKQIINNVDIKYILHQCKLLTEEVSMQLGVLPIINIDNERYISYIRCDAMSAHHNTVIYWHNIILDRMCIFPEIIFSGVNYEKCVINITNKDIFPNVARDRLMDKEKHMIGLAIGKATLQYIVNNMPEDKKLQEAIQAYINKNYPEDNPYYANDKM